ncbi:MAG TPA: hypothetical protein DEF79_01055 [Gammaproteobacteria bacterium]|nr:hypothetical protein [Gammaproteobacteria bacterium]
MNDKEKTLIQESRCERLFAKPHNLLKRQHRNHQTNTGNTVAIAKPKRRDIKLSRITECVLINAATTAPKDISLKVTRTNEFASVPEA